MITRSVKGAAIIAAGLVAVALAMAYADSQGWTPAGMDQRTTMALIGAILVIFGNAVGKREPGEAMPAGSPPALDAARRFFGVALVVGGSIQVLAWLFAPLEIANELSIAAVLIALVAGLVRVAMAKRAAPPA